MARPKKATAQLGSIEECGAAMGDLLSVTVQLEALTADRDLAVAEAQRNYEGAIDEARSLQADLTARLRDYYYAHLAEIEREGVKHVQLANGVMGRRENPPRLALLNRSWTWKRALELLRIKFGDRFLRRPEPELDKEGVKAELGTRPEDLAQCGLKIDQGETFYAEPARLPGQEVAW